MAAGTPSRSGFCFDLSVGDQREWDPGPLDVRLASTAIERDAVYRFRHRILGESEGRRAGFTASNGRLLEPFDIDADHLAAFGSGDTVRGVVRLEEFQSACDRRAHLSSGAHLKSGVEFQSASFSSRLLVDPSEGVHLTVRLLASLIEFCVCRGYRRDCCLVPVEGDRIRDRLGYLDSDLGIDSRPDRRVQELRISRPTPSGGGFLRSLAAWWGWPGPD